jgi:molybdopterin converting factor subunit 1
MRYVSIRLFARAKDLAGSDALVVALPPVATVGELRKRLSELCPALMGLLERSAVAVNNEFADDAILVPEGAEVALLPPVSGGARETVGA